MTGEDARVTDGPIGVFDSGEGGLTALRALAALLPGEDFLYACDSAHFPYGPRPLGQVRGFFLRFASYFAEAGARLVVVACNTATAAVLMAPDAPQLPVPAIGVVEPGARAAARATRSGRIGVVATQATVQSGVYPRAIRTWRPDAEVFQVPCPILVTLAENGEVDSPRADEEIHRCLEPLLGQGIDTLVLGCTHLPHMARRFAEAVGPGVHLVDPGREAALAVRDWLAGRGLLRPRSEGGRVAFATTGSPDAFLRVARRLWPGAPARVAHLPFWEGPPEVVVATRNPGKAAELAALLAPAGVRVRSLDDFPHAGEVEEDGATFEANARKKARAAAIATGRVAVADDSGLEVDALGGEPGVRSARWVPGTDRDRVDALLQRLEGVPDPARTGRFVSVVAVVHPDGRERVFRGTLEGRIAREPRGTGGFGYDPVLELPDGRTVAELTLEEKNAISHRGRAFRQALVALEEFLGGSAVR